MITSEIYFPWKRFWAPLNSSIELIDGYLPNPEIEIARYYNPGIATLEEIQDKPCVVLLGPPLSGKTNTIEQEKKRLEGLPIVWIDLKILSDSYLKQEFSKLEAFLTNPENQIVTIFIDSLERGFLQNDYIVNLLTVFFTNAKIHQHQAKIRLRIICQSAFWSQKIHKDFSELLRINTSNLEIYRLAPLREIDVTMAANHSHIENTQHFLTEIKERGLVPFATNPETLFWITKQYVATGIPQDAIELYRIGLSDFYQKINGGQGGIHIKSSRDFLAVAATIAAATKFCNRSSIWRDSRRSYPSEPTETTIFIDELCINEIECHGTMLPINKDMFIEVLTSGLFIINDKSGYVWQHQSYEDFLAAEFIQKYKFSLKQTINLISNPKDPTRLNPSLWLVGAWLAEMNDEFFDWLFEKDPKILLQCDGSSLEKSDRKKKLVDWLFTAVSNGEIDTNLLRFYSYQKLFYVGIESKLTSIIPDQKNSFLTRDLALRFAEFSKDESLLEILFDVVLDEKENPGIRDHIAYILKQRAKQKSLSPNLRIRSLSLLQVQDKDDDYGNLKALAFYCLWPDLVPAESIFQVLAPPRTEIGNPAYLEFANQTFAQSLQPKHLPAALSWLDVNINHCREEGSFLELAETIIELAWKYAHQAQELKSFANIIKKRLAHTSLFQEKMEQNQELIQNDQRRRQILQELFSLEEPLEPYHCFSLFHEQLPLVLQRDIPWLLEWLENETREHVRCSLISALEHALPLDRLDDSSLEIVNRIPALRKLLRHHLPITFLTLEEVKEREDSILENKKSDEKRSEMWEKDQEIRNNHLKTYNQLLEKIYVGELQAWHQWNRHISTSEPRYRSGWFKPDLTMLPLWTSIQEDKLLDVAERYLKRNFEDFLLDPNLKDLSTINESDYRALYLLQQKVPNRMEFFPLDRWKPWLPMLFNNPIWQDNYQEDEIYKSLLRAAYHNLPEQFILRLKSLLVEANQESNHRDIHIILHALQSCWNDHLLEVLLDFVKQERTFTEFDLNLIKILLQQKDNETHQYFVSILQTVKTTDLNDNHCCIVVFFLLYGDPFPWQVIQPLFEKNLPFGWQVIDQFLLRQFFPRALPSASRFEAKDLTSLYIWIFKHLSLRPDSVNISVRDVQELQTSILDELQNQEPQIAVDSFQRISEAFPKETRCRNRLIQLQDKLCEENWRKIKRNPRDLFKMIIDSNKRFVDTEEQLLDVLIESLENFQKMLDKSARNRPKLWNHWQEGRNKPRHRPLQENDLSNEVIDFLEIDLKERMILTEREVEVKCSEVGAQGERVDVHVNCISTSLKNLTCVIEVKGCWHPKVKTALENQLKNQYLTGTGIYHGIYLVFQFYCNDWDDRDRRKSKSYRMSIQESRPYFDKQAQDASTNTVSIRSRVIDAALPEK